MKPCQLKELNKEGEGFWGISRPIASSVFPQAGGSGVVNTWTSRERLFCRENFGSLGLVTDVETG